jgi:NAD(P)H-hydrate epimerase
VLKSLAFGKPTVLDADALSVFAGKSKILAQTIRKFEVSVVMTPHAGEFEKLFPHLAASSQNKIMQTLLAAEEMQSVIVYKGSDTVIATPDGQAIVNANAPPTLATAGSGDVLAGFIVGLLAQGMHPFHAAAAAVWVHGEAAQMVGAGLIAEDLPETTPQIIAKII